MPPAAGVPNDRGHHQLLTALRAAALPAPAMRHSLKEEGSRFPRNALGGNRSAPTVAGMGENPGRIARWHTRRTERADLVNSTGRLTVATRTVLVLLGAAAISAATVATFKHLGDVVPTVLTIVGAVFVVLGGSAARWTR